MLYVKVIVINAVNKICVNPVMKDFILIQLSLFAWLNVHQIVKIAILICLNLEHVVSVK